MKEKLLAFIILFSSPESKGQSPGGAISVLLKLDSIRQSSSIARHFADIYFKTTAGAIDFFNKKNERVQLLIERLETRFAMYFFRSAEAYHKDQAVDAVWKEYYADSTAPRLRYILYGINAHINGDIWQALTTEFSPEEIRELKPYYIHYHKDLLNIYRNVYASALEDGRIRFLHNSSFGLTKLFGKTLLKKWRKRQLQLAELYFSDKLLFEKKREQLWRKMNELNQLIRQSI